MHPNVWDEDGTQNLPGFITSGISDLLTPVSGYLILVPKLITMLSASMSFVLYPFLSTLLAWCFALFVFVVIAQAPMRLAGGVFLAVACMLIPSDPEVFGLPLYTFWWSALLLFVLIFWDANSSSQSFRAVLLFFASLSSPVCLVTLPLFMGRAAIFKKRPTELKLAILAALCVGIQLWAMWPISKLAPLDLPRLPQIIPVFLGGYTIGNILPRFKWMLGCLTLAYIGTGVVRNRSSRVLWGLVYLWVVSVLMSSARVDVCYLDQALRGPRYFLFPFIILSWLLLQFAISDKSQWIRWLGAGLLVLGGVNALPVLGRHQDDLDWRGHVYSAIQFSEYALPIHYDGNAALSWSLPMSGSVCADLLGRDPFARPAAERTYPYRAIQMTTLALKGLNAPDLSAIKTNEWKGLDYYSIVSGTTTLPALYEIKGSFLTSNAEVGVLTLHIRRGQQILFRSEPKSKKQRIVVAGGESNFYDALPLTSEWVILDFSNRLLHEEFDVRFIDGGTGWGEWSAIAVRKAN